MDDFLDYYITFFCQNLQDFFPISIGEIFSPYMLVEIVLWMSIVFIYGDIDLDYF